MLISIIVPSLNSPLVDQVVRGILRQPSAGHMVEVLVVGRDDQQLVPALPGVTFIDTVEAVGPARARNIGINNAQGDMICFLDADCVPAHNWLQRLITAFEAGHAVVGGGVILEWAGYWALCDDVLVFGQYLSGTRPGPRKALPSLNLCISRQALEACGGFDEYFQKPAGEDTDLCLRLRQIGYQMYCEPVAAVHHWHRRRTLWHILVHLYSFGAVHALLRARYPTMFQKGGAGTAAARLPLLVGLAAPVLATFDIGWGMFRGILPRRFWFALPGLILAKTAWYVGLATAMRSEAFLAQQVQTP